MLETSFLNEWFWGKFGLILAKIWHSEDLEVKPRMAWSSYFGLF